MLVKKLKDSKPSGFTIIEVMIVLGIAAAIMLIVLIAIPQLQRNQRNTARKDAIGRVSTEIQNFAGNNNGELPAASTAAGAKNLGTLSVANSFAGRYLSALTLKDPKIGADYVLTANAATPTAVGEVNYRTSTVCDGENPVASIASPAYTATARNFTLVTPLEGGATFCIDNR